MKHSFTVLQNYRRAVHVQPYDPDLNFAASDTLVDHGYLEEARRRLYATISDLRTMPLYPSQVAAVPYGSTAISVGMENFEGDERTKASCIASARFSRNNIIQSPSFRYAFAPYQAWGSVAPQVLPADAIWGINATQTEFSDSSTLRDPWAPQIARQASGIYLGTRPPDGPFDAIQSQFLAEQSSESSAVFRINMDWGYQDNRRVRAADSVVLETKSLDSHSQ